MTFDGTTDAENEAVIVGTPLLRKENALFVAAVWTDTLNAVACSGQ